MRPPLIFSSYPLSDGSVAFFWEDQTAQKQDQKILQRQLDIRRQTFDHLQEGVLLLGSDGKVHLINASFRTFFQDVEEGMHVRQLIQILFADILSQKEKEDLVGYLLGRQFYTFSFPTQEGETALVRVIPLPYSESLILLHTGSTLDVSEDL